MAGWSLGVSIFSLLCCQFTAPVGIVLAVLAMRRIDAQPQYLTGRGLAVAGLVVGIIATAFLVLQIVLAASGSSSWWGVNT
jgi:hypothetical protein